MHPVDPAPVITIAALGVVVSAGLFLVALAALAWFDAPRARRFLMAFASTASKHLVELGVRMLAGASFILAAPHMALPAVFSVFGWVLVLSTLVLAVVPWRLHRRFAEQAVPRATRYMAALGTASLLGGVAVIGAVIRGASV